MSPPSTLGEILRNARSRLAAASFRPSPREASLIAGHLLGLGEAQVLAATDRQVSPALASRYEGLLQRRLRGEPMAYLLGRREFFGRELLVDERVLIPRPETEHLVEAALERLARLPENARVLDLGTGSGCIALTLALERPGLRVLASDRSLAALAVAAENLRRLAPPVAAEGRVHLIAADLVLGIRPSALDLVVSNPPYVDRRQSEQLSPEVREYEPATALFPEGSGEAVLDRLFELALALRAGTPVLVEIGAGQLDWVEDRLAGAELAIESVRPDLAGIPRVVELRRR